MNTYLEGYSPRQKKKVPIQPKQGYLCLSKSKNVFKKKELQKRFEFFKTKVGQQLANMGKLMKFDISKSWSRG